VSNLVRFICFLPSDEEGYGEATQESILIPCDLHFGITQSTSSEGSDPVSLRSAKWSVLQARRCCVQANW
jgi:hypothetical protein